MEDADLFLQFKEIASEEEEWFSLAEDLRSAAEALEPKIEEYWKVEKEEAQVQEKRGGVLVSTRRNPDLSGIYFMLTAYAIENLCKGLWIRKNKDIVRVSAKKFGKLPDEVFGKGKGHDLLRLLSVVQFPLLLEDKKLALQLERSSVWSARYPVPLNARHKTVRTNMSPSDVPPAWNREDDLQTVKEFFLRVDKFVTDQLKAG